MVSARLHHRHSRGIFLIEIALVVMVLGIIASALFALFDLGRNIQSDTQDRTTLAQMRESLLSWAVRNGGLPSPLALATGSSGALSRTTLATSGGSTVSVLPSQNPYGAVPASVIGTASTSTLGTLWQYDVHPALRADLQFTFSSTGGWATLHGMNRDAQGTGGSVEQLCRNLNTLMEIERRLRADSSTLASYSRLVAPRVWVPGYETSFEWRDGLFQPTTAADATVTRNWILERSSASAFVVARPNPGAYARLDRSNRVFVSDIPDTTQKTDATAARNYRIYEHPQAGGGDKPDDDIRDYKGITSAGLLSDLQRSLQAAGQCSRGAATCLNHEFYVTLDNSIRGQYMVPATAPATGYVASGSPVGLSLWWTLTEAPVSSPLASPATQPTSPTASGKLGAIAAGTNAGQCMPAVSTVDFTSMPALYLNIFAVLPGTPTQTGGSYWPLESKLLLTGGSTGWFAATGLNSGSAHGATLRCSGSAPLQFLDSASGGYELSDRSAVSCTLTTE